ncbi:MAG: NrfD/PsrC family molybdoenzyme membrane anchor subunit [Thermomicrobiales bacterium]
MTSLLPVMDFPSDTFFTVAPEWEWLVVFYFFVGGLAGGASFLAAMMDLLGTTEDRPVARVGHLLAAPLMAVGGVLLLIDLNRPERFWHMFIQSETGWPMFKSWSPISFGAWFVGIYSIVAGIVFIGVLAEIGILPRRLDILHLGSSFGEFLTLMSGLFGVLVAGYTGVLLATTNRPLWSDTVWIGLLFLLSGVSAAAGAMILLTWRRSDKRSIHWLSRMDAWSSIFELAVIGLIGFTIGSVVWEVFNNGWGIALVLGVILAGILVPLFLHWRPRSLGALSLPSAAALVIVGSFILRAVVVMASEGA